MLDKSLNFAEVRFINRDGVIADLRRAATEAKRRCPEISRVLLFGSLVRGDWTANSDADLAVVVRRKFSGAVGRARYQIFTKAIPTDNLVFSETEFEKAMADPHNALARELGSAIEL